MVDGASDWRALARRLSVVGARDGAREACSDPACRGQTPREVDGVGVAHRRPLGQYRTNLAVGEAGVSLQVKLR